MSRIEYQKQKARPKYNEDKMIGKIPKQILQSKKRQITPMFWFSGNSVKVSFVFHSSIRSFKRKY